VGVGSPDLADDAAGLELALGLRMQGEKRVATEWELMEKGQVSPNQESLNYVFLDAIDFKAKPGKIILLPLKYVLNNSTLSHRFLPFTALIANHRQLCNSYVLGIQPDRVTEGKDISVPVRSAIAKILDQITHRT